MDNFNFETLADLFKVFGDSTRLRLLKCIDSCEKSVGEIAAELGMTDSAISHQLSLLRRSKLIKSSRKGRRIFYSLSDEHVHAILACGIEHIEEA